MKQSIRDKLEHLDRRLEELDRMLAAEDAAHDMNAFRDLSRERAEIEPVVALYLSFRQAEADCTTAREMLADVEMRELGELELEAGEARIDALEDELQRALLPRDPNDGRNLFLEIRAGTGGDEAALFAGDLLRMYARYAEQHGWRVELVSVSASDLGGYKEVIARVSGSGAFSRLKFESGGHRVQRVPVTETQGRIHTSTATVAVMPEAEEVELELNPKDLRIDTFRSSGAGGQHINKTSSAIRVTHLPTGMVVECQDQRSQRENKEQALKVLRSRLLQQKQEAYDQEYNAKRQSQVGSGDRSEKIRTYNFPQDRVTDHRIGLTLRNLQDILDGNLDRVIEPLILADQEEKLKNNPIQ